MVLIKNRNMTDLAFYYWIKGFPLSGHAIDRSRFLGFIITARHYKSKKYDTYRKFKTECLAYLSDLTEEEIKDFWHEKQRVEEFLDEIASAEIPMQIERDETKSGISYIQSNIIDHKLYRTEITEEEFSKNGITIAEVKRRHNATD